MLTLQELRRPRVCGLVVFDTILALIGLVVILSIAWKVHFSKLPYINFAVVSFLILFPLAIFSHILVGVDTTLNYNLGLSGKPKE